MVNLKISDSELKKIDGGITVWAIVGIISAGIFLVGLVDGFVRPLKCND